MNEYKKITHSPKLPRVPRSESELLKQLVEQLQFLRDDCEAFDRGALTYGKRMAVALRILLHTHRRQHALLSQLKYLETLEFVDSGAMQSDRAADVPQRMLLIKAGDPPTYEPMMMLDPFPPWIRMLPFEEWWNTPAVKDGLNHQFSRKDLVVNIAETDGGVHIDAGLTQKYHAVTYEQSMLMRNGSDWLKENIAGQAGLALMRQISHEVLHTLHQQVPGLMDQSAPILRSTRYERVLPERS
jgi:hypothetical protein